jgi:hypothetical protein
MAVADTNYCFIYVYIGNYGKDICYGHQFRQICWNYPVRELYQEQKVHIMLLWRR